MQDDLTVPKLLAYLAGIGALVGLGKLLMSKEPLSFRLMLGRTLVSTGLAVAAGSVLAFIPGVSQLGLIGLAAASSVLGEQFLERLVNAKAGSGG